MYTQCPECGTAFRVTVDVLKQAAGKVRCGGCRAAFNALDYLSEQKPAARAAPRKTESVPELDPEPVELEPGEPPKSISAEQSAALLKTLDELAGSDIRIEDTGIEWRVLDDDEDDEAGNDSEAGSDQSDSDATSSLQWFMDESPTPVDEPLSADPGVVDAPEIFENNEATSASSVMRFDDNTPLPDDFDFESQPAAEPDPAPVTELQHVSGEAGEAHVDLALGEPEDWEDLLGEVDEPEPMREPRVIDESDCTLEDEREALQESAEVADDEADALPDVDEQFATQAEAMGIDLSGTHEQPQGAGTETSDTSDSGDTSIEEDLFAAAFEAEARSRERHRDEPGGTVEVDESGEGDVEEDIELDIELELADESLIEPRDRELVVSTEADATLAAELGLDDADDVNDAAPEEPVVPPPTEEEMTVNMMIDQDLLAIAVEDEHGFASTIVQKQPAADSEPEPAPEEAPAPPVEFDQDSPLVETIIMEGDRIRDTEDDEAGAAAAEPDEEAPEAAEATAEGTADDNALDPAPRRSIDYRLVAGIGALALLLAVQILHQSRATLATNPLFNSAIAPIYRMLGRPVTPAWEISGWRFEATKGSTDQDDEVLTIYSRVGNKSDEALPYPLISVSLTDRFEDILGSKVLGPGEYLSDESDIGRSVAPGNTFSAVISIESPDDEATGFKLNVCYRQPGGLLKCAVDDFK